MNSVYYNKWLSIDVFANNKWLGVEIIIHSTICINNIIKEKDKKMNVTCGVEGAIFFKLSYLLLFPHVNIITFKIWECTGQM